MEAEEAHLSRAGEGLRGKSAAPQVLAPGREVSAEAGALSAGNAVRVRGLTSCRLGEAWGSLPGFGGWGRTPRARSPALDQPGRQGSQRSWPALSGHRVQSCPTTETPVGRILCCAPFSPLWGSPNPTAPRRPPPSGPRHRTKGNKILPQSPL